MADGGESAVADRRAWRRPDAGANCGEDWAMLLLGFAGIGFMAHTISRVLSFLLSRNGILL